MEYNINSDSIRNYNGYLAPEFPRYTSQLINLANGNAQGTRPRVVGQMSELFPDFIESTPNNEITIEVWRDWYIERHPDAIETATNRIYSQINNLSEAIQLIDRNMVSRWAEDLIINKTFYGMYVQNAILAFLSERTGEQYRLATPEEEARGIDGYVGATAYSIKPESYRSMGHLPEAIDVRMIYYTRTNSGLTIQVEERE